MMKKLKKYCYQFGFYAQLASITAIAFLNLAVAPLSYAQGPPPAPDTTGPTPGITLHTTGEILTKILCPIFDLMFWILIVLSIIMTLWAGYMYATAQDDTEKTSKARRTITYAAIGVVVALVAKGFPALIGSIFISGSTSLSACAGF